jgi:alkylhydroperoxidase family enzyme
LARQFGVPEEKIAAIADFRTRSEFTERERAALALAEAMTRSGGQVEDEVWSEAARYFDEGELIELVAVIGMFNAFNRMANALQVEITR